MVQRHRHGSLLQQRQNNHRGRNADGDVQKRSLYERQKPKEEARKSRQHQLGLSDARR
jgi:hypothetical protein